ncbi:hypothetical protein CK203_026779 [Vitis vinifera]|uniref:Uncharacterized protein n=1 Tax=Vitis vinifera TaxID=29760 RepID=A0A438IP57_VITVI|nr:hypothetical protein CK203_026779 [Vitis vinifera]
MKKSSWTYHGASRKFMEFLHSPSEEPLRIVFRIFKHLKGTPGKGLNFGKEHLRVEVYTDTGKALLRFLQKFPYS